MTGTDRPSLRFGDAPLPPELYPWRPTDRPGVLADRRFVPSNEVDRLLAASGARPMAERHHVLAIGSNASPAVMHRKMVRSGIETPLAMTITLHGGIAVGHSAHVSLPGYVAAAPYRCARCVRRFVVLHLDDEQITALDATEPNYDRIEHRGTWIYVSQVEVLAARGVPVTLRPQIDLHSFLRAVDPRWSERFGNAPAPEVARLLAHDGTVNDWGDHWRLAGLTRDAGFRERRSGGSP